MNKHALLHKSESEYCFPLDNKRALIRFRCAKDDDDIKSITVLYNMSAYFSKKQLRKKMELVRSDDLFSYYEAILECEIPSYMYIFELVDKEDKNHYYIETGLSDVYNKDLIGMLSFRVPFINKENVLKEHEKFKGDVIYQIFPERFLMGEVDKDKTYINESWDSTNLKSINWQHNKFLGGDLKGIILKLDYIKDLGVDTLYLTPVTSSYTNHKYNIDDYYKIDPHFGSNETYKELVKKAHEKGLKIIMDLVFNHTSDTHPFFKDVLKNGKGSKYYDFYCMQEEPLKTDTLNYYSFNSSKYMPKINTNSQMVVDYFSDVIKYYLNEFDVDGFRLDVANEVSHIFWIKLNRVARKIKPDCLIIGENWDNAHEYLKNYEFDGIMNYTFLTICWDYFSNPSADTKEFVNKLNWLLTRYPNEANKMSFNLLDSHDVPRFIHVCHQDKDLYLLGLVLLISYIGLPMIYYGDEIFMDGSNDPDNRRGMKWDSKEFNSPYHELFKNIVHLRKLEVFRDGDIRIKELNGTIYITRFNKKDKIHIVINKNNNKVAIDAKNIILFNRFCDNNLLKNGFVVYRD